MDSSLSVRDVMNRTYVGVSEGDSLAGAAGLMCEEGDTSAVVLRGSSPIGMLHAVDILGAIGTGREPSELTVEDVMAETVDTIDSQQPLDDAIEQLSPETIRCLIVMDERGIAGLLTEREVVRARAAFTAEPASEAIVSPPGIAGEDAAAGTALADQGVCELCGSLTRTLRTVNGQAVCADCQEI